MMIERKRRLPPEGKTPVKGRLVVAYTAALFNAILTLSLSSVRSTDLTT